MLASTIHALANHGGRGKVIVWLITLAILAALVHFELWPIAAFWFCYMVATSLTTPDQ